MATGPAAGAELTSNVHWHLFNLSAVELLDFPHHPHVILSDEIDSDAFPSETTTATNAMNVVFTVSWKIVVDDERDLLHVDPTSQKIGGNQHTGRTRTELLHDDISLSLFHVTVHGRDSEITGGELVGEPVYLSSGVAEDDCLRDSDSLVEIGQSIQLPVFFLDSNVKLLDTLKG